MCEKGIKCHDIIIDSALMRKHNFTAVDGQEVANLFTVMIC